MGEIALVGGVGFIRLRGELVGPRRADVPDELLEVVFVFHEPPSKLLEELLVDRRIADADIVDVVDEPGAEEVRPDDVHEVLRKERVVGAGQPSRHHLAPILAGDIGSVAAEELRRNHPAADRMLDVATAGIEDDRLARILPGLAPDLREEVGEAVVVVHRPAVERMVVALGTLDPHPHEHLRDVFRHLQRVGFVLVVIRGGA